MEWKSLTSSDEDIALHVLEKEIVDRDHHFSFAALFDIKLPQTILFTCLYIFLANISQSFVIDAVNVSPIWIPSGVMFALALRYGVSIWLSIFLATIVVNFVVHFDSSTTIDILIAGLFNGIGDAISIVGSAAGIYHITKTNNPLHCKAHFTYFILVGAIAGPLISAIFGVLGLAILGFITLDELVRTFYTWWIGDSVGVLVLAPLLLSWFNKDSNFNDKAVGVLIFVSLISCVGTAAIFDLFWVPIEVLFVATILIPLLLVTVVHYGQRVLFTVQAIVLGIAVVATARGYGPFTLGDSSFVLVQLQWFIAIFSCTIFGLAVVTYENQNAKEVILEKMNELEKLYRTDNLTKVANRHLINEFITSEFSRMSRSKLPFGVILIDLDDFKQLNDQYGHNFGDQVLVEMCSKIKSQLRANDLLGRWGGEEFIVICDNLNKDGLIQVAEKIRKVVEQTQFHKSITITISLGMTIAKDEDTINSLTKRADDGLYQSKRGGKNRSTYFG